MALAHVIPMPERPRSAQAEERYTRVPHSVLEALALADFGKRHYKILMVLMRQTYGYDKAADEISLTQFHDKTGVLPPHISAAIGELIDMQVLVKSPGRYAASLSINKDFDQWIGKARIDTSKILGYQNGNEGVTETVIEGYQNSHEGLSRWRSAASHRC